MSADNSSYDDKRSFIRMTVDCKVTYCELDATEQSEGRAKNLSGKGILFQSDKEIPMGTRLRVDVHSSNNAVPPLNASIEVVRVEMIKPGELYEIGGLFTEED